MKRTLLAPLISLLMLGCNSRVEDTTQTVEWFSKNPNDRKAMLAKCRDNPGELSATPNCVNASVAERSAATKTQSLRF
ncbi:MAG TPA: EexN family lipoprotein [Burkholderiaceae bacterium]|nr:EexN family lipoprotein [Burkholderiaceae bacterium]HPW06382.1 EexN family lipoprotein [Burkholderiaceae bacterium]